MTRSKKRTAGGNRPFATHYQRADLKLSCRCSQGDCRACPAWRRLWFSICARQVATA